MYLEVLSWVMSFVALLGTILNTNMRKEGFYLWFFSNIYIAIIDFKAGLYAQAALFTIYALLAIRGILVWNRKQSTNNPRGKPKEKPIKTTVLVDKILFK